MKKLLILGALALCLAQLLTSCCIDPIGTDSLGNYSENPPTLVHKTFNPRETKAGKLYFTWENGMEVLVVSLDSEGAVMYTDVCTVSNATGGGSEASWASIEADVAEEAKYYFMCYPATAVNAVVDEVLQENYTPANEGGKLKDVAILACKVGAQPYADMNVTFYPKNSLLYVGSTLDVGEDGVNYAIYDLKITMYTKEYPNGKYIEVPRSFKYSNTNPYYIHVSTQDLGIGSLKNGVAVLLTGYCGDTIKYYFWGGSYLNKKKGMTIDSLPVGAYKKVVPSINIKNQ